MEFAIVACVLPIAPEKADRRRSTAKWLKKAAICRKAVANGLLMSATSGLKNSPQVIDL
jgi:hypothetical protein